MLVYLLTLVYDSVERREEQLLNRDSERAVIRESSLIVAIRAG